MLEVRDAATLVRCAEQAAITLHAWQSREPRLGRPDLLVLDPSEGGPEGFADCKAAAREEAGPAAYVMATGSEGLYVHSPLRPEPDDREVGDLAEAPAERAPGERTTEVRKDEREGRPFVDYLRNGREQSAVAPYSVRAREGRLCLEREECPLRARSPKRVRDRPG